MNITFLIGNGFDRNLGLETTYSDFVKEYKKTNGSTETLKEFRAYIKDNEELWSTAEVALGEYTGQFGDGEAEAFSECHADFCEHLATYLKEQESQIDYDSARVKIEKAFSRVNKITQVFPMQEREIIDGVYSSHASETRTFNFLWAVAEAARKKKLDCSSAEFLTIDEGECVQIMHLGAFDDEPATVALIDEYVKANGYENDFSETRLHHEIYLTDARKVAPEKWKTVIRHPIKKVE